MPRLNGTGPEGKGSMTGRGLGQCRNVNAPTEASEATELNSNLNARNFNRPMGNGLNRGLGFGRRGNSNRANSFNGRRNRGN